MNKSLKFLVFSIFLTVMLACSVKKDAVLKRNFHALTTKYNVLFNGEQAYLKGLEDHNIKVEKNLIINIDDDYKNYEKILEPILRDNKMSFTVLSFFDYIWHIT